MHSYCDNNYKYFSLFSIGKKDKPSFFTVEETVPLRDDNVEFLVSYENRFLFSNKHKLLKLFQIF